MESPLQQVASLQLSVKLASAVLGILVIHAAFLLLEEYCLIIFSRQTRDIIFGSLLSSSDMLSLSYYCPPIKPDSALRNLMCSAFDR